MCNPPRTEPSLDELLEDSAMRLLMRRDGVTESDVRALLRELKDARAVAMRGTKRGRGGKAAGHAPDRGEMVVADLRTRRTMADDILCRRDVVLEVIHRPEPRCVCFV